MVAREPIKWLYVMTSLTSECYAPLNYTIGGNAVVGTNGRPKFSSFSTMNVGLNTFMETFGLDPLDSFTTLFDVGSGCTSYINETAMHEIALDHVYANNHFYGK